MRRRPPGTPLGEEARPRVRAPASSAGEGGFTLTELIIASAIGMMVIGATADFMVTSMRSSNAASSRTIASRQAELFLARLTREVRQAQNIRNATTTADKTPVNVIYGGSTTSVSFYLPNPGSSAVGSEVTWSCSKALMTCNRTVQGGAPVTQLTGVVEAKFTPYSSKGSVLASGAGSAIAASPQYPSSIQLIMKVQVISQLDLERTHTAAGVTQEIIVQDGVSLRNYSS